MYTYYELDEDSMAMKLKNAREEYSKKIGRNFSQQELAEYLGIGISTVGGWEQGRRNIPEKFFIKINNLLGTDFKAIEDYSANDLIDSQYFIYFYLGMYKFTKRQSDYIIAKLLISICKDILSKEEIKKYEKITNYDKKYSYFNEKSKKDCERCYNYILKYIKSLYIIYQNKSKTKKIYYSKISKKTIKEEYVKQKLKKEIYKLLTTLDFSKYLYEPNKNLPVYNSSGVIEFYEEIPTKFNDNQYEYVFWKINNLQNKFPPNFIDGSLALVRLGNFCFSNEYIIIKIDNSFKIEYINNSLSMKELKEEYSKWLIDFEIVGAIVMIDYSYCSSKREKLR